MQKSITYYVFVKKFHRAAKTDENDRFRVSISLLGKLLMDYLPIPPPYRLLDPLSSSSISHPASPNPSSCSAPRSIFINEQTREGSEMHPIEVAWENVASRHKNARHNRNLEGFYKSVSNRYWKIDDHIYSIDRRNENEGINEKQSVTSGKFEESIDSKSEFFDFRCVWRESGFFGTNSYGLVIRYLLESGISLVKFDGIEGEWKLSVIEGPHGPLDRNDLFIGGRLKLFGRSLTISTANASACHWIDVEGKRLQNTIKWLQTKIENVGAIPIIRREVPAMTRHIQRSSKAEGHQNLRKLKIEIAKLGEQLAHLGLSRLLFDEEIEI